MDIAAKKIPSDLPFSNKQLDSIVQKIKFMPVPKHICDETVYREDSINENSDIPSQVVRTVIVEKNTNERAIVRLRIPKRRIEEEFVEVDEKTGAEYYRKVERLVEIDIDDKVLVFPALVSARDYTIYALNQSAPRAHRREFYNALKKNFVDYFEGRDAVKDYESYTKLTEQLHEKIEKRFIEENFDEEKMPILDFEINLNEGE